MLKRHIMPFLKKQLSHYPAVSLIGPRQCGKTTIAQSLSPLYFDMEQAPDRLAVDIRWPEILKEKHLVVFDEAQQWPELFSRLRSAIDQDRKHNGRFLLLGSVAPSLMRAVSESLAGRLALCELSPLLQPELPQIARKNLWLRGGYPDGGILNARYFPHWQKNYLTLLAQRDLPLWGLPSKPQVTERLFAMIAATHGMLWNASHIGKSLGMSYHTVNSYLDYLEQAFLIRRLLPYAGKMKKRLTKSPKIYWRDSGVLHALLHTQLIDQLLSQPWVGHSWEGWVIEQIIGTATMLGQSMSPFFLRTQSGEEIDLILQYRNMVWAIEIKLTSQPDQQAIQRLQSIAAMLPANRCVLISQTKETIVNQHIISTNPQTFIHRWIMGRGK